MNEKTMTILADAMFAAKKAEPMPETHDCSCKQGLEYDKNSDTCNACVAAGSLRDDVFKALIEGDKLELAFKLIIDEL